MRWIKLNVIMSIKPKYVKEIIEGNKRFEYRKKIFKQEVDKIYIYESSPKQRIVGFFKYNGFIEGNPIDIWNKTNEFGGIEKKEFDEYFKNRKVSYALRIEKFEVFSVEINPKEKIKNFSPPQSYRYIDEDLFI